LYTFLLKKTIHHNNLTTALLKQNTSIMDNLQELEEPAFKYQKAGFLQKNIAGIIDAILVFIFGLLIVYILVLFNLTITSNDYSSIYFIYFFVVLILYRVATIFYLSSTIGMRITNLKYLNESVLDLTKKEKFLAALMVYINNIDSYNVR
jgi:uncharacterized RDD family membrane protein YckC